MRGYLSRRLIIALLEPPRIMPVGPGCTQRRRRQAAPLVAQAPTIQAQRKALVLAVPVASTKAPRAKQAARALLR